MILLILMNPGGFPILGCFTGGLATDFVDSGEFHSIAFVLGCSSFKVIRDTNIYDLVTLAQHILASVSVLSHITNICGFSPAEVLGLHLALIWRCHCLCLKDFAILTFSTHQPLPAKVMNKNDSFGMTLTKWQSQLSSSGACRS